MDKKQTEINEVLNELSERKGLLELEVKAWKALLQSTKVMIAITDVKTGKFVYVNPAFRELLGYNFKELISKEVSDFLVKDDVGPTQKTFVTAITAPNHTFDGFINRYVSKTGKVIYVNWFENIRLNGTWLSFVLIATEKEYKDHKRLFSAWKD